MNLQRANEKVHVHYKNLTGTYDRNTYKRDDVSANSDPTPCVQD